MTVIPKPGTIGCKLSQLIPRFFPKIPTELGAEAKHEYCHKAYNCKNVIIPDKHGRIKHLREVDTADHSKTTRRDPVLNHTYPLTYPLL